jgi:hypothetical protein
MICLDQLWNLIRCFVDASCILYQSQLTFFEIDELSHTFDVVLENRFKGLEANYNLGYVYVLKDMKVKVDKHI